ncbi:isoprenylcysteine carboxylmethyltransferase family protein [Salinisphaera sp. Q1T1-3]|uniref:methyltransferase family protein n=1 Tax=Salinisphaera sp. Q1T1-3 TaxID=2321229 RepID=UPI000E7554A3|nr:methyltransferase [Salinisphaera sp. Q1T1-3]RJS92487.1 isoprenylcysteine carboxylmethyltransferase family protein [Salinisphaera sp. Q1T1-3]
MTQRTAYRVTEPWFRRLASRRLSPRQVFVHAAGLAVLALAEPDVGTFIFGSLFVLGGLMLRAWTFGHLEKNHRLATTGPYAHSRNPAYLGTFVILLGIAMAAGNNDTSLGVAIWVAGALGIGLFFLGYLPRKFAREHARMAELFPQDAARHAAHVPAFWPRLSPWRSGDGQRFCLVRLRANHELAWSVICVTGLAVMWL